ncbi:MAG: serine hydrolase [Oscillospiraceae bacterium]|nr:serine hydrolase [Oscillospiraceae bacterium]
MKLPEINRQTLRRWLAVLLAFLLALALLVLIPLLTHREPRPDRRYTEHPPQATQMPLSSPAPVPHDMPDPTLPEQDPELEALLSAFIEQHPGTWDIYVYNLTYGEFAGISTQEDSPMVAASLIKLFIMGAVFQQFKEYKLPYNETWPSIRKMITTSDNYCANWLTIRLGEGLESAGIEEVTEYAHSLGCGNTSMNRTMLDTNSELENYTTAEEVALLFKLLYRYELVSPEYSADMLSYLKAQTINDRIPAGLPAGTVCAHKTGDLPHICCADAGLIFSPGADYILSVINNGSEDDKAAAEAIVELSAQVYQFFNPPTQPDDGSVG